MNQAASCISLFSGIGGLDLGLEESGFEIRLCVENDRECVKSLVRQDRPLASTLDITSASPSRLLEEAGLAVGELSLLAGGPPCQPFSKARQWAGKAPHLEDPRAFNSLNAFLHCVERMLPQVVLIENVLGFGRANGALEFVQLHLDKVNQIHGTHYALNLWKLNAAEYGVPQSRRRAFAVACRDGKVVEPPPITHGSEHQPFLAAWDAIGDLEETFSNEAKLNPKGRWAALLPSIPEGQNYLHHTSRGDGLELFGYRTKFWSFLLKLAKCRPSWTIPASPGPATGPFHWKNRLLAIPEILRLQTFSENHPVSDKFGLARRQVGNAVPPALGEAVGRQLLREVFGIETKSRLRFLPRRCKSIPPPEPLSPVPPAYLKLEGKHEDHPGSGLGPRAHTTDLLPGDP